MAKHYHIGISIRGLLRSTDKELRGVFRHKTEQRSLTPEEARDFLMDELKAGHEVNTWGDCDNFDAERGCLGHETPSYLTGKT